MALTIRIARFAVIALPLACASLAAGQDKKPDAKPNPPTPAAPATPATQPPPKPTDAKPDPKKDTKPADANPADAPSPPAVFPPFNKKQLWATNDLRGTKAPKFQVEKWLTPTPAGLSTKVPPDASGPDFPDKVVLIDFWATWCRPCRELIPELEGFKTKFADDLVVIGVSDEKEDKVSQFLKTRPIAYSIAIDTKATMKNFVGVQGIPHVIIIDSQGIVRWQGFPQLPEDPLKEETIRQIIAADKAARAAKK